MNPYLAGFLLGFVLEITYLIVPAPLDFLIEHFPWLAILIFFGLLIHLVVLPYFEIYNSYFEMAPGKLVAIQGLFLAFKREDQFIPYNLIRGCRIEQNICGRIFDYADTDGIHLFLKKNLDSVEYIPNKEKTDQYSREKLTQRFSEILNSTNNE